MWECANCGKENRDERVHCWHCSTVKGASHSETVSTLQNPATATAIEKPSTCLKCSAPLDEDAKFCPSCAAPVLLYTSLDCPRCGRSVNASAKFCKYCAADLTQKEEYSFGAYKNNLNHSSPFQETERRQAENLLRLGAIVGVVSAIVFFWGTIYTNNVANSARASFVNLVGQTDATFQMATWAMYLGAIGFIAGVIMVIVGWTHR